MPQDNITELLWSQLISIENIDERIVAIYNDIQSGLRKYQILAQENPRRFFELLGGNDSEITTMDWAYKYTYEDYIKEKEFEYDVREANDWDLEEKSLEHAHETGNWYVTGVCVIQGPDNIELEFEFEYCEGYIDGVIGTPYYQIGDKSSLIPLA